MDNKEELYKKYRSLHAEALYGKPSLDAIRREFFIWDRYYGDFLPRKKSSGILDIGCGLGGIVFWLTERGFANVVGIDISEEEVAAAHTLGLDRVEKGDIRDFSSPKPYDVIFALDVLEHFKKEEIPDVLRRIHNVLSPGGVLIIKTPNAEGLFGSRLRYADFTHEIAFTESSLREILSLAGFTLAGVREAGPVVHGFLSFIRFVLWMLVRWKIQFLSLIETGTRPRVLTQNIIAIARKQ